MFCKLLRPFFVSSAISDLATSSCQLQSLIWPHVCFIANILKAHVILPQRTTTVLLVFIFLDMIKLKCTYFTQTENQKLITHSRFQANKNQTLIFQTVGWADWWLCAFYYTPKHCMVFEATWVTAANLKSIIYQQVWVQCWGIQNMRLWPP